MKSLFALLLLPFSAFPQAGIDYSRIPVSYLPKGASLLIVKDIKFPAGSTLVKLGRNCSIKLKESTYYDRTLKEGALLKVVKSSRHIYSTESHRIQVNNPSIKYLFCRQSPDSIISGFQKEIRGSMVLNLGSAEEI